MPTYYAFGLQIASDLPLPELLLSEGSPDVHVRYGSVPQSLAKARVETPWYQAAPGQLLLDVDGVGRFLVEEGHRITIDRAPEAADTEVRLFLLGSAFGALLQQRSLLTLHASAIAVNGHAVAFLGWSGVGKSTLATSFHRHGYALLTDDVCVIRFDDDGTPIVVPGYPQAKLWADALERFDLNPDALRRVRPQQDKHAVPTRTAFSTTPCPLARLYVLDVSDDDELSLTPIEGSDKFIALTKNTYRMEFVEGLDVHVSHFQHITRLATQLPMCQVRRPRDAYLLDELMALLKRDFDPS